jgi:hypothetical protein
MNFATRWLNLKSGTHHLRITRAMPDLAIAGQGQALERLSVDDYGRVV